jgi:hypothetical protein
MQRGRPAKERQGRDSLASTASTCPLCQSSRWLRVSLHHQLTFGSASCLPAIHVRAPCQRSIGRSGSSRGVREGRFATDPQKFLKSAALAGRARGGFCLSACRAKRPSPLPSSIQPPFLSSRFPSSKKNGTSAPSLRGVVLPVEGRRTLCWSAAQELGGRTSRSSSRLAASQVALGRLSFGSVLVG